MMKGLIMTKKEIYDTLCDAVQDDWTYIECDVCGKQLKNSYLQCGADNNGFACICRKCFLGK